MLTKSDPVISRTKSTTFVLSFGLICTYFLLSKYSALNVKDKKRMSEEEVYEFPDNLEGFGYKFNEEGKMRSIDGDEPFEFNVREGDFHYNQKRYNALGDVLTELIYQMLEKDCKLQRTYLPTDAEENEPKSFVFISGDLYTNEKMLILIHGSGVVRAGQWARRLIINDCLDSGTQIPYIKWGRENGYSILVANTNLNTLEPADSKKKKNVKIRGNASPEEHTESLWREFVQRNQAVKHVAIVAHSYGGVCTLELTKNHIREFEERVFAIALTDSVHGLRQQEAPPEVITLYKQRAVNWASAYDPLDHPLITSQEEVPTVSAGTDRHENTSYSSMKSIFKYLTEKYQETIHPSSKRVSMGEPNSLTSPVSSEEQHLITRDNGEGEESSNQETATKSHDSSSTNQKTDTKSHDLSSNPNKADSVGDELEAVERVSIINEVESQRDESESVQKDTKKQQEGVNDEAKVSSVDSAMIKDESQSGGQLNEADDVESGVDVGDVKTEL